MRATSLNCDVPHGWLESYCYCHSAFLSLFWVQPEQSRVQDLYRLPCFLSSPPSASCPQGPGLGTLLDSWSFSFLISKTRAWRAGRRISCNEARRHYSCQTSGRVATLRESSLKLPPLRRPTLDPHRPKTALADVLRVLSVALSQDDGQPLMAQLTRPLCS